ncbi:GM20293 [Drosophila sechellia]|uniref:GM20293 n=1 Tax=Drosophila sechellia TaxID=7238 RepID=B4HQG6_DROSE|nr:GM20293 [Drosophila sechellia]
METEINEEPQIDLLEENEAALADEDLSRRSGDSKKSDSVKISMVSMTSSENSEERLKIIRKEERKLAIKDIMNRLKERDAEEMKKKQSGEEQEDQREDKMASKSQDSIQRHLSISQVEEQDDETLLWTKMGEDIDSDTRRNTDIAPAADTLEAANAEDEDMLDLIETPSESDSEAPVTERSESIDPMKVAVKSLMLVPSLSDISLPIAPVTSRKSSLSIKSNRSLIFKSAPTDDNSSFDSEESEEESTKGPSGSRTPMDQLYESVSFCESLAPIKDDFQRKTATKEDKNEYMGFEQMFPVITTQLETDEIDIAAQLRTIETSQVVMPEHRGTDEYIRARLDKEKLLVALQNEVHDYRSVRDHNKQLEERMVDYFRRTKNFRYFDHLPQNAEKSYSRRLDHALTYLSYGQERLNRVKEKYGILMTTAFLDLANAMNIVLSTEHHLEQTLKHVLVRPDAETDFLKRLVTRELRLMADHRNQISDARLLLMSQKHTLARILEKIRDVETVCDGVSLNDFITVQNKTIGLEKKLEERNIELKRQRRLYHTDLHITKHNREKSHELKNKIHLLNDNLLEKAQVEKIKLKSGAVSAENWSTRAIRRRDERLDMPRVVSWAMSALMY